MAGEQVNCPIVFQVLGSRRVNNSGGTDSKNRYRLLVSDGKTIHSFAMLATEMNHFYEENKLPDFTIIKVDRYVCSVVNRNEASNER